MRIFTFILCGFILLAAGHCSGREKTDHQKGHLIIIGGGKRPQSIMEKFVELSGGPQARIAIIPTASSYFLEVGKEYEQEFLKLGAARAQAFNIHSREEADRDSMVEQLKTYSGYFFGGGDQNRLTEYFLDSKTLQLFHDQYQNGATFGGTSAGAAVMSSVMITGDGNWEVPMKDSVKTTTGFAFMPAVIIDQHFFKRRRFNRLLNVVIENQTNGIGIDESTAIWVKPDDEIEVLGESVVIVLHTRRAGFGEPDSTGLLTARGIELSVYKNNERFRLE